MEALQIAQITQKVTEISQEHYGDHTLDPICGAGKTLRPDPALVFINPTHRNISTAKSWDGIKAPWIGCANIWQLFADAGLIDQTINQRIQLAKTAWSPELASEVYQHVAERELYITNIVKWAGLDARLPEAAKIKLYAPILIDELKLLRPRRIIAFGQLTFEGLLRELNIKSPQSFGLLNETMLSSGEPAGIATELGEIIPCYFPVGQGIKNRSKAIEILRLVRKRA